MFDWAGILILFLKGSRQWMRCSKIIKHELGEKREDVEG
jgi:hypothetical protein